MGRLITISQKITGIAAAKSLVIITAPDFGQGFELVGAMITDSSGTDSQQLEACIQAITVLGTPTGSSNVALVSGNKDNIIGCAEAVLTNITASEPTYAGAQYGLAGFNGGSGYAFYAQTVPGTNISTAPCAPPNGSLGLRLLTSPGTAFDCNVWVCIHELGIY